MLKTNYHTHNRLCGHAIGTAFDYVKEAVRLGYEVIGLSDHGPIKREFMTAEEFKYNWLERQMTYDDFINIYLKEMDEVKKQYGDKIKIYAGLEIEYLYPFHDYFKCLREKLDYLNLGVHFYYHNDVITNSFDDVNYTNVYSYGLTAKKAMETGLYQIMVHPDVYMYHYKSYDGSRTFDAECAKTARLIIEAAIQNNVYLEINCGGLFKCSNDGGIVGQYAYPRDEFWEIASEYKNLKVVIGIDAHDPKQLNAKEIDEAKAFAAKHHIKLWDFVDTIK